MRACTSFLATETVSNINRPCVCTCWAELNREDRICLQFVDISVFPRVQKQMQLLSARTSRKRSGLHLLCFFPTPCAPVYMCTIIQPYVQLFKAVKISRGLFHLASATFDTTIYASVVSSESRVPASLSHQQIPVIMSDATEKHK